MSWSSSPIFVAAITFVVVVILIVVGYFIWRRLRRRNKVVKKNKYEQLVEINSEVLSNRTPTKKVEYQADMFEIPGSTVSINGHERNLRLKPMPSIHLSKHRRTGVLDIEKYEKLSTKRKLSSIPRLGFEIFYCFRTTSVLVSLRSGKYLPEYENEQIVISVMMSHCTSIYHTARYDGSTPIINEDFTFPLESMQISSDPPVLLKFNVWTVDKYSRKNPYGYIEANIEEIFTENGLMAVPGKSLVWRNIMRTDTLTDESLQGELLVSLAYLPGAQRISVILIKAKDLPLTSTDKEIQGKISLFYREEEQRSLFSSSVEMCANPAFNEEFVFHLSEFRNVSIDGIVINIALQSKHVRMFMKPRELGKVMIGSRGSVEQSGREHWNSVLTSRSSTSRWHLLKGGELN